MAYYDENGRITIDEVAAQNDIRRTAEAQRIMEGVLRRLKQLLLETGDFQGETAGAITEKAGELMNETKRLIGNLEETQTYISKTVAYYKWLDEEISRRLAEQSLGG